MCSGYYVWRNNRSDVGQFLGHYLGHSVNQTHIIFIVVVVALLSRHCTLLSMRSNADQRDHTERIQRGRVTDQCY